MIVLESNSLFGFLRNALADETQTKKFLLILPHSIAIRNFNYSMMKHGIDPRNIIVMTFDHLADCILQQNGKKLRTLLRGELTQLAMKAINSASSGSLTKFKFIPLENNEAQETLLDEFTQFLRATDIGSISGALLDLAKGLTDQFASRSSIRFIESFNELEKTVQAQVALLGPDVFTTRAHKLKRARENLSSKWPSELDSEVLIYGLSVFDSTVLKLITTIDKTGTSNNPSFTIRIFPGKGTYIGLLKRLEKTADNYEPQKPTTSFQAYEFGALREYAEKERLKLTATPDRRREVETAARKIHELLLQGAAPFEILLMARDCSKYLNLVSEIFPAFGISVYVQTRRPYAHLAPYRFMKAALDLIAVVKSSNIEWHQITDPLRLGFCLQFASKNWPVEAHKFIYLEESLASAQRRAGTPLSIKDWIKIAQGLAWNSCRVILTEFLDWVQTQFTNPPKNPKEARYLIARLLQTYMFNQSKWIRESSYPRIPNQERFNIIGLHPTHFAARIRSRLIEFEDYLNDSIITSSNPLNWELIAKSFGEVFGKVTYGLPLQDNSAIRLVDIGNAHFLEAKHLFILGLKTDEFPRQAPKAIFLPDQLRDTTEEQKSNEEAFIYLRNRRNDYANEVDLLQTALETNPEYIYCSMPYLDEKGHEVGWSSFVEELANANNTRRILPNEWLPSPKGNKWIDIAKENPPWTRQRLYCYHANRQFRQQNPPINDEDIQDIASTIDPKFYSIELEDRIERYLRPPTKIEINHDETWFKTLTLASIVGPPFRTHEMDLHATCPLQYYFFQFLFLWNGDSIDRDTVPYYTKKPHWRYGRLPKRLSYIYPSNATNRKIEEIIKIRLPQRQTDLSKFTNRAAFEIHLATFLSDYDRSQFLNTLCDEWSLAQQENRDNITREWDWVTQPKSVEIGQLQKVQIMLPAHRIDSLQGSKLIIAFVNFSGQLGLRKEGLMYLKKRGKLEPAQDPLRDHRLPILLLHYATNTETKVAGGVYAELFEGKRAGYYNSGLLMKHKGPNGYHEELPMYRGNPKENSGQVMDRKSWDRRMAEYNQAIAQRATKMTPKPNIAFQAIAGDGRLTQNACLKCVYNDLCRIPWTGG